MRLIQIRVTDDARDSVLDALDDANADYVIADEAAGNDASIVYFPTPAGAVEEMLDKLAEAGLEDDAFTTSHGSIPITALRACSTTSNPSLSS